MRRYLRPDLDVIELGGSIGAVTCEIARRQSPGLKIVSVEANPSLISLLRKNLAANVTGHSVTIVHRAVDYRSDRTSVTFIRRATSMDGVIDGAIHGIHANDAPGDVVQVPTCTLSALLEEHRIDEYSLISDIEGAEVGIIRRDAEALKRCRQIVIELHDTSKTESIETLREALVGDHGFRLVDRNGPVCVFERAT